MGLVELVFPCFSSESKTSKCDYFLIKRLFGFQHLLIVKVFSYCYQSLADETMIQT